ncbi:hypothetical protein D3C71_1324260 [compost metagenome]
MPIAPPALPDKVPPSVRFNSAGLALAMFCPMSPLVSSDRSPPTRSIALAVAPVRLPSTERLAEPPASSAAIARSSVACR